jgi:hypothetical protein
MNRLLFPLENYKAAFHPQNGWSCPHRRAHWPGLAIRRAFQETARFHERFAYLGIPHDKARPGDELPRNQGEQYNHYNRSHLI